MTQSTPDTDHLLDQCVAGDQSAADLLFQRCRPRLLRMLAVRLDPGLVARVDPSDVVQESLAEAYQKFPAYLETRPIDFYPWLRAIAWQRLVKIHRAHLARSRRGVFRESKNRSLPLPDESTAQLVDCLASPDAGPSEHALVKELQQRVRSGLAQLDDGDRELLVMRYLEHMPLAEVAQTLSITLDAAKKRHRRALERLELTLSDDAPSGDREDR